MQKLLGSLLAVSSIMACNAPPTVTAPDVAAADVGIAALGNPVVHRVTAGGADFIGPGGDANWSLVAMSYADGSVRGQWSDAFGHGNGGFHAVVTCLEVSGNEAWISGIATGGDFDGRPWLSRVRDNGTSTKDAPDEISYSILGAPGTTFDCRRRAPLQLFPRDRGQVTVD